MATGHFFKQHDDVGAPLLDNTAGALIAVLDWALDVAGATYWEKVFSGTNKAVYRSKTGIRAYLHVDDTLANYAVVHQYESMTDVDTGVGPCPDGINQTMDRMRVFKGAVASTAHDYYIVGDSEFFHMTIRIHQSYWNYIDFFFGEVASTNPLDSYNSVIGAPWTSYTYHQYYWNYGSGYQGFTGSPNGAGVYYLRSSDGVNLSSGARRIGQDYNNPTPLANYDYSPRIFYSPLHLWCSHGRRTTDGDQFFVYDLNNNGHLRGRLPYIYNTHISASPTVTHEDTVTIGASTFRVLKMTPAGANGGPSATYGKLFLIRTSDDEPDRG